MDRIWPFLRIVGQDYIAERMPMPTLNRGEYDPEAMKKEI